MHSKHTSNIGFARRFPRLAEYNLKNVMADNKQSTDGEQATGFPPVEGVPGESFDSQTANDDSSIDTNDSGDGEQGDESSTDQADADPDDDSDNSSDEDSDAEHEDDGSEPPVRDSSYYIGLRHGKKAVKQTAKEKESDDDSDSGDDEDLTPEEEDALNKHIQEAVSPLVERITAEDNAKELNSFLSENPDFKPFKAKIERYMNHDTRKHLPVTTIAMEAVGPEGMMKIGAKMARQSDQKKSGSRADTGGGSRNAPQGKSVMDMSDAEFAEYQNKVRSQA